MMAMNSFSQNEYQAGGAQQRPVAQSLFSRSRSQAAWNLFRSLFGWNGRMPSLTERLSGRAARGQHALGLRVVEIENIAGTESRADDFDAAFNPRSDRIRDRWVRIAELRLCQAALPAVELLQVGSEYFVRDGHHRVSVARALGNAFIDAHVTVIEV